MTRRGKALFLCVKSEGDTLRKEKCRGDNRCPLCYTYSIGLLCFRLKTRRFSCGFQYNINKAAAISGGESMH